MKNKVCMGLVGFLFLAACAFADAKKQQDRVENSGKVIKEILTCLTMFRRIFSIKQNASLYCRRWSSSPSASEGVMAAA